ncbi:MAG: hypothetical protein ACOYIR_06440 [Christensenellales bacterium]
MQIRLDRPFYWYTDEIYEQKPVCAVKSSKMAKTHSGGNTPARKKPALLMVPYIKRIKKGRKVISARMDGMNGAKRRRMTGKMPTARSAFPAPP